MAFLASIRIWAMTLVVCSGLYMLAVLAFAQLLVPASADGQLIERDGEVVGSAQIAQKFEAAHYLWPRPSAADYNGAAASGSNKATTNPEVAARGKDLVAKYGATEGRQLPVELATTSGAGLDPHITLEAARYQASRIAAARSVPVEQVEALFAAEARNAAGPLAGDRQLVNVLKANLALDAAFPLREGGAAR